MLGINSSTCRTEKCVGAELRSKVNFLNEIEIAADGLMMVFQCLIECVCVYV